MAGVSYPQLHENDHDDHNDLPQFNRQNQVNFIMDMFHQRMEQSQSQSQSHDNQIDDREVLNIIFESHDPVDINEFEQEQWEVILNAHNLEANSDYENLLFGQFTYNDASNVAHPPASINAVENLLSILVSDEDFANNNTLCAVCKDEIDVGLIAKKLPCDHWYHDDCIVTWLGIRNTCPVCRHELLTDDPDYERRKARDE